MRIFSTVHRGLEKVGLWRKDGATGGNTKGYAVPGRDSWYPVTSQFLVPGTHEIQLCVLPLILEATSLSPKQFPSHLG